MKTKTVPFKKTSCHMEPLITDFAENNLPAAGIKKLENHVEIEKCPTCRDQYLMIRELNRHALEFEKECSDIMSTIDWEDNAYTIANRLPIKEPKPFLQFLHFPIPWLKSPVPALIVVFLLGIGLGYFLFHSDSHPTLPTLHETSPVNSLDRIEQTLARKEVTGYFQQTQLVLSDMMKQCEMDGSFSLKNPVDLQRVRTLLDKGRYFNQNLNDPQLLGSKLLLEKIEWLLYEILILETDKENSCRQLEILQQVIRQENLLLKIRLAEKELSLSEV